MKKKRTQFNARLDELKWLSKAPLTDEVIGRLKKILHDSNNYVASKAVETISVRKIQELIDDLLTTYKYFSKDPIRRDKSCLAKTAIVKALNTLEFNEIDFFLSHIRYQQLEPVYGGKEDTAADLRSNCIIALARLGYPDIFFELTTLLMDREIQSRLTAVEVLSSLDSERSELLLRLKCLAGDKDARVMDECFIGLLNINLERSIPFVGEFLQSSEIIIAQSAALALGESRNLDAFRILSNQWKEQTDPQYRKMLILPMCLIREDEAIELLLAIISNDKRSYAVAALQGLKIYQHDTNLTQKIKAAVDSRKDNISSIFQEEFGLYA